MNKQAVVAGVIALLIGLGAGALGTRTWLDARHHTEVASPDAHGGHEHAAEPGGVAVCEVTQQIAKTIGLRTQEVNFGPLEEVVELLGSVEPVPELRHVVAARTAGQVLHLHVQVGDRVKTGDVLVEIDSPELARNIFEARRLETDYLKLLVELTRAQGRVRQLEAEGETCTEAAGLAEAQVARLRAAEQVVPLNELNDKQAVALQARARVRQNTVELQVAREEAEALGRQTEALRLSRDALLAVSNVDANQAGIPSGKDDTDTCEHVPWRLGLIRLRAPIDGVVMQRHVSPGQGIAAGEPLLVVADYREVQVHGELPESLLNQVPQDQPTMVRIRPKSDSEQVVVGTVRFISPVIDPVKRTAHLIVDAPNPDGILHDGAFVRLAVIVRDMANPEDWPIVVPVSAVVKEGPVYYVFKQDHPGELIFQRQEISPGVRDDQVLEVCEGLFPGDLVVTQGAYSLSQMRRSDVAAGDPHAGHSH